MIQGVNITSADAAIAVINIVVTCLVFLVFIVLTLFFLGGLRFGVCLNLTAGVVLISSSMWCGGKLLCPRAACLKKLTFFSHYFLLIPLAVLFCKLNDVFVVRFNREVCAVNILTTGRAAYSH